MSTISQSYSFGKDVYAKEPKALSLSVVKYNCTKLVSPTAFL